MKTSDDAFRHCTEVSSSGPDLPPTADEVLATLSSIATFGSTEVLESIILAYLTRDIDTNPSDVVSLGEQKSEEMEQETPTAAAPEEEE